MGSKDELHTLFNKIVGSEIARIRTETNVGQEDFARKACVSRQWVSRFETGKSGMNLYSFFRFTDAVGINATELFNNIANQFRREAEPILQAKEEAKYNRYVEQTKKKKSKGKAV